MKDHSNGSTSVYDVNSAESELERYSDPTEALADYLERFARAEQQVTYKWRKLQG